MNGRQAPAPWRISLQGWLALFALGILLWLGITTFQVLLEVCWVLFGAYLLSLAIRPLADRAERWRLPRGLSVLLVYAALLALLAGMGGLLVPVVTAEINSLRAGGPSLSQGNLARLIPAPLAQWLPSPGTLVQSLSQRLDTLLAGALGTVAGISSLTIDLLALFILAYFFVVEVGWGSRLVLAWIEPARRARVAGVIQRIRHDLTRWTLAQLGIGLYFATTFSIGLAVLGVPFALTIGLISGLLGFIPYVGSLAATLLAVLSALTVRPLLALWALLLTSALASVEVHLVAPMLYGRAMGLRTAIVLVALLIGAKAQGIVGIIFAVPVAAVLATVLQEVQKSLTAAARSEVVPTAPDRETPRTIKKS